MAIDDPDDPLSRFARASEELEARFRDLEAEMELDQLRGGSARSDEPEPSIDGAASTGPEADPLADLKAAFDAGEPASADAADPAGASARPRARSAPKRRVMTVLCPSCGQKNRVPLERLRAKVPVCGACKTDLAYWR